jgi:hypothetical protein
MSTDLPTGSISGQQGWEWNRLQTQQGTHDAPTTPANRSDERRRSGHTHGHREGTRTRRLPSDTRRSAAESQRSPGGTEHSTAESRPAQTDASRRELAAELELRERRVQNVIDHYEQVLAKKNRQLANQHETTTSERVGQVLSSVFGFLVR